MSQDACLLIRRRNMKKLHTIICLLLVSLRFVYAQPSDAAINSAISWAQSLVGQKSFPLTYESGYSPSFFGCGDFVSNAYGWPAAGYYAYKLWDLLDKHLGDLNAPRGSLVFFERNDLNFGAGHVALSLGNGDIIEAGYDVIIKSTINDENYSAQYLGWAWPRSLWPGRSAGHSIEIKYAIPIVLSIAFILGSLTVFLIIKSRKLNTYKQNDKELV